MHVQCSAGLICVRVMHDQCFELIRKLDHTVCPIIKIWLLKLVGDDGGSARGDGHFLYVGRHYSRGM